jgi:hypothetical protein
MRVMCSIQVAPRPLQNQEAKWIGRTDSKPEQKSAFAEVISRSGRNNGEGLKEMEGVWLCILAPGMS